MRFRAEENGGHPIDEVLAAAAAFRDLTERKLKAIRSQIEEGTAGVQTLAELRELKRAADLHRMRVAAGRGWLGGFTRSSR
jgi:hypothetical protein